MRLGEGEARDGAVVVDVESEEFFKAGFPEGLQASHFVVLYEEVGEFGGFKGSDEFDGG